MSEINRRTYEYRIMCEFVVFEIHTKPRAIAVKDENILLCITCCTKEKPYIYVYERCGINQCYLRFNFTEKGP